MDNNQTLINRLELLEASASIILKEAARIKKALLPVSTGCKQNKGLSEEQAAKLLAKRRKNQQKSNERNMRRMGITT